MSVPVRSPADRIGDAWTGRVRRYRPAWLTDDILTGVRWGLIGVWIFAFCWQVFALDGIPWLRSDVLLWIVALLLACSVGRRSVLSVVVDFLPFAAVLVAYDYLRGFADTMGMPTWWHPQADVDRWLAGGHNPTVWLQEHLKFPEARWWDVVVSLCYFSFFFLPYVTAGVLWLRSRAAFYRWSLRFVVLSFVGFAFFALIPAAPPWAAARCGALQVTGHPHAPACMYRGPVRSGGLLGPFDTAQAGAAPWVQRISIRGFDVLDLHFASSVIRAGQVSADNVAAVPSLHLGGTLLFVLFVWPRSNRWWRPLLVAYPLLMTFSLVYSGEHYVADCLAGALVAVGVHLGANRFERRRREHRAGVAPLDQTQPLTAPPPPRETTQSSS